jgi:hypothetical protein
MRPLEKKIAASCATTTPIDVNGEAHAGISELIEVPVVNLIGDRHPETRDLPPQLSFA